LVILIVDILGTVRHSITVSESRDGRGQQPLYGVILYLSVYLLSLVMPLRKLIWGTLAGDE